MMIQFNTDKTIVGQERQQAHYTALIEEAFQRYASDITRIEIYLKDENGKKTGRNDQSCSLEARLEGMQPITVTSKAASLELATSGAIDKLRSALDTTLGKLNNHEKRRK